MYVFLFKINSLSIYSERKINQVYLDIFQFDLIAAGKQEMGWFVLLDTVRHIRKKIQFLEAILSELFELETSTLN